MDCSNCYYREKVIKDDLEKRNINPKINRLELIIILLIALLGFVLCFCIYQRFIIYDIKSENKLYKEMLASEIISMNTIKTKFVNGRIVKDQ